MRANNKFDTCTESQQARLLSWLRKKPITTLQARHQLDILGVASRVHELRHLHGLNIQTHWTYDENPGGGNHRIGLYVLAPGKWKGGLR